jgi:predicted AAA+ superfamily ATPase
MYIQRGIEPELKNSLFMGKAIILYGPRRSGKSTVVQHLLGQTTQSKLYLNCDEGDTFRSLFRADTSTQLKEIVGNNSLVVIDEAQRIKNIGLKLKLLVDNYPEVQIIATGSSSFDLSSEIFEPMTGRVWEYRLYPLSVNEIFEHDEENKTILNRKLESLLIYGSYPEIYSAASILEKENLIKQISRNYLYKDVLKFNTIKASEAIQKLLEALALQVGSEVSYGELGNLLNLDYQTVRTYVNILEQAFIIFKIPPLSRNLRKEIGKSRKIYFWDNGVRNALINNFNPLSLRSDIGQLWENFIVSEIKKKEFSVSNTNNFFFWRTYDGQEIDLVEEKGGKFIATEIKWTKLKKSPPKAWKENYSDYIWNNITKDNYLEQLVQIDQTTPRQ